MCCRTLWLRRLGSSHSCISSRPPQATFPPQPQVPPRTPYAAHALYVISFTGLLTSGARMHNAGFVTAYHFLDSKQEHPSMTSDTVQMPVLTSSFCSKTSRVDASRLSVSCCCCCCCSEHCRVQPATWCAGSVLPTMHVALLEAGGPPLLSPPNWPHLVLTLQDCVMVEQRRVFRNVSDEVTPFCATVCKTCCIPTPIPSSCRGWELRGHTGRSGCCERAGNGYRSTLACTFVTRIPSHRSPQDEAC